MFTTQLPHIFTTDNLKLAFEEISKNSSGLDEISYKEFLSFPRSAWERIFASHLERQLYRLVPIDISKDYKMYNHD